jgi:hypothetical protein
LGRDLIREEDVLGGPTESAIVFGEGVYYHDVAGNVWCDDALTEYEMNLICGLHNISTGTYSFALLRHSFDDKTFRQQDADV